MSNNEIYSKLKALQNNAFSLSKIDKAFIRETSKDLNVEFNPKTKCENCYRDQIIILLIAVKKTISIVENANTTYRMINGKSIKWSSYLINSETITDEIAEKFIANVKSWRMYIEKI